MKLIHLASFCLSAFLIVSFGSPSLRAAESVSVKATLIHGSNEGGGVDAQLRQYERNLRRVLGFDTFRQQGSGSAGISTPGSATINMGGGHSVAINLTEAGDDKLRIATRWTKGGQAFINTTVVTARNQPTVLVGPASGEGKQILLLVAR